MDLFSKIEFTGMFALGSFVSIILLYGLDQIEQEKSLKKIYSATFGATFSGVVFIFLQLLIDEFSKWGDPKALFMYPIGLLMTFLWVEISKTVKQRVVSQDIGVKVLGYIHILGVASLTILIVINLLTKSV